MLDTARMSYSDHYRGSWSEKLQLSGRHVPFSNVIAGLGGLWLFSLVSVAIWAAVASSKRDKSSPLTAGLNKFWVTICIAIVVYAFTFTFDVLEARGAEVAVSYLLAESIFATLTELVDICMLINIYYLLFRILRQPASSPSTTKKQILWTHYGFCVIVLGPLWLADLGLVAKLNHDLYIISHSSSSFYKGTALSDIVGITFDALYVCASLEVVVGAIMTCTVYRQGRGYSTSGLLLLVLVAFPLLVRSVVNLGFHVRFAYPNHDNAALSVAAGVLYGLCWFIIFIGIVIVSLRDSVPTTLTPFNMENAHEPARGQLLATDSQPIPIRDHSDEESPLDGAIYSDRGESSWGRKMHWPGWRTKGDGGMMTS